MNLLDIALAILLLLCAVRGFWRGVIRESFGFAAFILGLLTALRLTESVAKAVEGTVLLSALPDAARVGGAFVLVFLSVNALVNLSGFVLDRLIGGGLLRAIGSVAGGLFGVAKGAAVLAFVLLFAQLFPVAGDIESHIADSRLARPMIAAADNVLRGNWVAVSPTGDPA